VTDRVAGTAVLRGEVNLQSMMGVPGVVDKSRELDMIGRYRGQPKEKVPYAAFAINL